MLLVSNRLILKGVLVHCLIALLLTDLQSCDLTGALIDGISLLLANLQSFDLLWLYGSAC